MSNMFNALNRFISRLDGEDPRQKQQQGLFGFQVLRNVNIQLAVEPWFDFIVGINGRVIVWFRPKKKRKKDSPEMEEETLT